MPEVNFREILGSGFRIWKKNLIICVPFILGAILTWIVVLGLMIPTIFATFFPLIQESFVNASAMQSPEFTNQIVTLLLQNIWLFIGVIIIIAILGGFIMSFFTAGAIGMAKEALLTQKTNLSHMTSYGKKKFMSYFGASVLTGLVACIGFLFLIPGIMSILAHPELITPQQQIPTSEVFTTLLPLIIGGLLMILYILPMSIILLLVPYAVVLDDLSSVEGFKKGIRVVWQNKIYTFALWLIILVLGSILGLLAIIPFVGSFIMLVVLFLVYMPLVTIWCSKFYLAVPKP